MPAKQPQGNNLKGHIQFHNMFFVTIPKLWIDKLELAKGDTVNIEYDEESKSLKISKVEELVSV